MRIRIALLVIAALAADVARAEIPPEAQGSGSLLLRMQSGYRVATRLDTDVDIRVSGMVARVSVRQRFRNDGASWTEGIYVFPLPADAAVDRLRMHAGERIVEGELREKAAAKKAYEKAKKEGRRASLVGQQRQNLFTTSLANLGPGEAVTIEIGYLQPVAFDDGTFSLRFPTTFTPRYVPGMPLPDRQGSGWSPDTDRVPDASLITPPVVASSRDHGLSLRAEIDAGMPLEIVASRYHPIDVEPRAGVYDVTLNRADSKTDHDFELVWRPAPSAAPRALAFGETVAGKRHLLVMLLPPDRGGEAAPVAARSVTFVIDTSGSMHGTSIAQAKEALALALEELRPGDTFNVIQFNSVTDALHARPVPATQQNVQQALAWLRRLEANGGTEMRPALELALRADREEAGGRLRQVVFVTDGAVGNETGLFGVIESRLGDARLFTVGIGSAPNGWFMREAAEAGRGTFTLISAQHEVREKMSLLLSRLGEPVLTDIALDWPAGAESYPAKVRDLYRGEPVLVRARLDPVPRAGDQLIVRGDSAYGPWSAAVPLGRADGHAGVAALWGRSKLAAFADALRQGGDEEAVRPRAVETALAYGLVSRYTSLVAVDRTPVRPAGAALDREQVPNLLPYGQSHEAIFGFPATATAGPMLRLSGSLLILIGTLILFYRVLTVRGPRHAVPGN